MLNSAGGVLVYLPPEVAAAYQSHGINFVSARPAGRRRAADRRGATRGTENTDPEIDCTTPYDFEAANAELEAELAKITISPDGVPMPITSQSGPETNTGGLGTGNSPTSTGDRQTTAVRSPSAISAAGNGASGDSTLGAAGTVGAVSSQSGTATTDGSGPLAKGEYYVREKCFFDQISRPESGPRNSFAGDGTRYGGRTAGPNRRFAYGHGSNGGFSSLAAARRERQLNLETFGSLAARTTFIPRRRAPPPGHMHRDYLVSAPA